MAGVEKKLKKMLVCQPQAGVTHYQIELNGQEQAAITAMKDGSLEADLTGLADGTHKVRTRAGARWSKDFIQWGPWSAIMDFVVFRPKAPNDVETSVKEV
jgi:hypothetical protein